MWRCIILLFVSFAIATGFGAPAHAMPQTVAPVTVHCLNGNMHHDRDKGLVACGCCDACSPAIAEPASAILAYRSVIYGPAFLILPVRTPPGAIHSPDPFPPRPARIG